MPRDTQPGEPQSHTPGARSAKQENTEHTLGTTQKSCFPGKLRLLIQQCQLQRSGGEFLFKLYKSCSKVKIFFLYKNPVQCWIYFFFTWPGKSLMTFTLLFFPLNFHEQQNPEPFPSLTVPELLCFIHSCPSILQEM